MTPRATALVMALRPRGLCRSSAASTRATWLIGSAGSSRSLCVVVGARGGSTACGATGRLGACQRSPKKHQPAVLVRLFATRSDAGDEQKAEKKAKTPREETERTAALLKRKLALDVETARNLALHQVVNVPNVITFARILSTPYLAYLIVQGDHAAAMGLLTVAGLSDWLDGYIARRFNQQSIVGSLLDPFADKVLVGSLSLSMIWTGLLPWQLVALILGRDLMLVGGTFYHRLTTKDATSGFFDTSDSGAFEVKPTLLSKVNTALQLSLFGFALTNAAWQIPGDQALHVLFGLVGSTTLLSGSEYLWSYVHQTGAFKPLRKAVEQTGALKPLRKAVERTKRSLRK